MQKNLKLSAILTDAGNFSVVNDILVVIERVRLQCVKLYNVEL